MLLSNNTELSTSHRITNYNIYERINYDAIVSLRMETNYDYIVTEVAELNRIHIN